MLISRKQSTIFRNSDKCIAYWYKHNDKDLDISYAEIKGEYPTTGFTVNKKVKEMIYIVKGTGEITTRGKKYKLKKDDTILIQKNQKYSFKGNLGIITICSPAWWPEQHKIVK